MRYKVQRYAVPDRSIVRLEDGIYKGTCATFAFGAGDMDDVQAVEITGLVRQWNKPFADRKSLKYLHRIPRALPTAASALKVRLLTSVPFLSVPARSYSWTVWNSASPPHPIYSEPNAITPWGEKRKRT